MRVRRRGKILLSIIVISGLVALFFSIKSGFLTVKIIDIEGKDLGCVNETQLKNTSGLTGKNFLFIDYKAVEKNLKDKFFCIKSVIFSKYFPDRVKLHISGRQPFAALVSIKEKIASVSSSVETIATPSAEDINGSYIVDDEGVVFIKNANGVDAPEIYINDLDISLGGQPKNDRVRTSIIILSRIESLNVDVENAWVIGNDLQVLTKGSKIIFSLKEKTDIQLASLQLILAEAKIDLSKLEFIDLRFDKPIVKFAPKK